MRFYFKTSFIVACLFFLSINANGQSFVVDGNWKELMGGAVNAINYDSISGKVYLGGSFQYYGNKEQFSTGINTSTGKPTLNYSNPNGIVTSTISDGNGGWYIGGEFTMVGDSARSRIAHIDSLGNVTAKIGRNGVDNTVYALALDNNKLYVGGDFKRYGPSKLSTMKFSNFNLESNFPSSNGLVSSCVSDGNGGWYLAGNFTRFGDNYRNNLVHVLGNGQIDTMIATFFDGTITALHLKDSILYVGGTFKKASNEFRNSLAAINVLTGNVTSWNPNLNLNSDLRVICSSGNSLYVGGVFNSVNGQPRQNFAEFNINSGQLNSLNLNVNGPVNTLCISDSLLFIGGQFSYVNGLGRTNLASLNIANGTITNWNPSLNASVRSVLISGTSIFVGGDFTTANTQNRNYFAEYNLLTGQLSPLNLVISGSYVTILAIQSNQLIIGGSYSFIGGQNRKNLAAYDLSLSTVISWSPDPNDVVSCIAIDGLETVVGGRFNFGGGLSRNYALAVNLNDQSLSYWNPSPNFTVLDFELYDTNIFLGGRFTNIGGQNRDYIAMLDTITGFVTPFNVALNSSFSSPRVNDLQIVGDTLFFVGKFNSVNSQSRNNAASIDLTSSNITGWNPNVNGEVLTIEADDTLVFLGGQFLSVGGQTRSKLASVYMNSGSVTAWNPSINGNVNDIIISDSIIYIGGYFSSCDGIERINIAAYDRYLGQLDNWNPTMYPYAGKVHAFALYGHTLYTVGEYSGLAGVYRSNLLVLDSINGEPSSWNPIPNGEIKTMEIKDSILLIGGVFSEIDGMPISRLAKLDVASENVINWNPNINNVVNDIDIFDSTLFIGGMFTNIGGQTRNRLASFNLNNGTLQNWNPEINDDVITIAHNDTLLFVGGEFTSIGTTGRIRFAAFNLPNLNLSGLNSSFNGVVRKILVEDSTLLIGGDFTEAASLPRSRFAQINLNNASIEPNFLNFDNSVYTISKEGNKLFFGGTFAFVGNEMRSGAAIINRYSFQLIDGTPFDGYSVNSTSTCIANQNYDILSFCPINNDLLIGGDFVFNDLEKEGIIRLIDLCPETYSVVNVYDCDSIYINNEVFHQTGTYTQILSNNCLSDSIITLNLTITPSQPIVVNSTFSLPSDPNNCLGELAIDISGNGGFDLSIDNGAQQLTSTGYSLVQNVCPGVHDLHITDYCGDTLLTQFVIPVDSNYVFNNPFIDSIAVDSLGTTATNCTIYYNSIDTAYIDSIWATGNTVNVIWNIVDSNGSNFDTTSYVLNNGNGVYWLQLSVFCPTKTLGDYFTVTQAINFENGGAYLVGMEDELEQMLVDVYPNPTNNEVTIAFDSNVAQVIIYDTQGKLIQGKTIHSGEQISLKEVETGVYFFEVMTEKGSAVKRVVKN